MSSRKKSFLAKRIVVTGAKFKAQGIKLNFDKVGVWKYVSESEEKRKIKSKDVIGKGILVGSYIVLATNNMLLE